jgi:uncharacterized membrane protein (UPF0127 family)
MRVIALSIALVLVAAACSAAESDPPAESTTTPPSTSTTVVPPSVVPPVVPPSEPDIPPQLEDSELREVSVGDKELLLAIADSPGLRATGLMFVEDLGDLDGMLFYWSHEASSGFWMKNTVIPLDIVWFDRSGEFVGRESMVPCPETPCPIYVPGEGVDYRYAIEANPGDLDWVTEDTRIVYSD